MSDAANACRCGRSFATPQGLGLHHRAAGRCTECKGSGEYTVRDDDGGVIGEVDCKWCLGAGEASVPVCRSAR